MKSLVAAVSVAVVLLLAAACGGDGGEPSTAEPAATAPPVSEITAISGQGLGANADITPATAPPVSEITAISDQGLGANADITLTTTADPSQQILALYSLEVPLGWNIAGDFDVTDNYVTAVGTMNVDVGEPGAVSCDGNIEHFAFNLRDELADDADGWAQWGGNISGFWALELAVSGSLLEGFTIEGLLTDTLGVSLCTPQTFTITFCGRANPDPDALVCGSGSDPIVMTNPTIEATYIWQTTFIGNLGIGAADLDAVCISDSPCSTDI